MKIVLEMLTVTFNIPKNMPRMKIYLNRFLISIFIASATPQLCPGPDRSDRTVRPVRPVCQRQIQSPQGRIIRHETRSSDMFQRQTGTWTASSDLESDHPTLYNIISKNVLFQIFCLGEFHDMIFISCTFKTNSLLERH